MLAQRIHFNQRNRRFIALEAGLRSTAVDFVRIACGDVSVCMRGFVKWSLVRAGGAASRSHIDKTSWLGLPYSFSFANRRNTGLNVSHNTEPRPRKTR